MMPNAGVVIGPVSQWQVPNGSADTLYLFSLEISLIKRENSEESVNLYTT